MFESPGYLRYDLSLLLLVDFDTHEMFLHLQRLYRCLGGSIWHYGLRRAI